MLARLLFIAIILSECAGLRPACAGETPRVSAAAVASPRTFFARGIIQEISPGLQTVVIQHEAISNYMAAMTMPFKVREGKFLTGWQPGDEIRFRLNVTADESWVDQFRKIGTAPVIRTQAPLTAGVSPPRDDSFMDDALTNELGRRVTLRDFHGEALAITFFYTRCPLPDFCPRLSKNFQEATVKLRALPGGPTNWHFLSISFDTDFDTPPQLAAYGEAYGYHPNEWSFLTGSPAAIRELASVSGVTYSASAGGFQHNFRTLIVDATGHLQMVFPMGGNIADSIVAQILKAAAATNHPTLSTATK